MTARLFGIRHDQHPAFSLIAKRNTSMDIRERFLLTLMQIFDNSLSFRIEEIDLASPRLLGFGSVNANRTCLASILKLSWLAAKVDSLAALRW